jgi:hypothetical protein
VTFSKVLLFDRHESWEDNVKEEEQLAKINIDRKTSSYNERECLKNHRSTGTQVTPELYIQFEYPDSTETKRLVMYKSSIHGKAAIAKPLTAEIMLRCVNDVITTVEPGRETTGNARVIWSDESSFTLFPTSGRVCVWRTPKEAYNPECLVGSNTERR